MNAAIDRDFDAHVERIREFLRIPSVSAADGDLRSTAAAVCELIEAAGGTAEIAEPGERRPTVIGVIDGPGPTVLRYGMYDVQPPGSGWTRDPFAAEVADGRIYARGAANSKAALAGGLLAFAGTRSPCRQVLLMEGEEELGSPRLGAFWAAHREELRADWALDFDLAEGEDGSAPVVAGCKGLHELELRAGDGVDVHSAVLGRGPVAGHRTWRADRRAAGRAPKPSGASISCWARCSTPWPTQGRIQALTNGRVDPGNVKRALHHMIPFLAAGFRSAPVA